MPNRILKESICSSESIDQLSWFEEAFFYRLIVNCDDFGIMDGRLAILKSRLFPLKNVTEKQILEALDKLSTSGMISIYLSTDGKPYLKLVTWSKHQQIRAKKSKYPIFDSTCNQMISDVIKCYRNPIQSNPILIQSESEREGDKKNVSENPLPQKPYGQFKNIFLTVKEVEKLKERFGETEALERIEAISESFRSHKDYPKKYTDHYATILSWARLDEKCNGGKHGQISGQSNSGKRVTARTQGYSRDEYRQGLPGSG